MLLHQSLHGIVVDNIAAVAQFVRNTTVAISTTAFCVDFSNLLLELVVFVWHFCLSAEITCDRSPAVPVSTLRHASFLDSRSPRVASDFLRLGLLLLRYSLSAP